MGAYFKGGAKPVSVWASQDYTAAAAGGTGAAKCGGNYAASLIAQAEAIRNGCDQVVFLDAAEKRWVEELGGMNVFFVFDDGSVRTPGLTGTILPGITRDSIITLARFAGHGCGRRPLLLPAVAGRCGVGCLARGLRLWHRRGGIGHRYGAPQGW
ncbi:aminotransferase class IV [Niveispirillum cyanobacteriorum]|uniref:aminotransferase class IV n=1 Tax=Niveispirillum cyanobacteriorum TaxID=1612173 RepID=UPI003CCB768A